MLKLAKESDAFLTDLFNDSKLALSRCPFLANWALAKVEEFGKAPTDVDRRGVPRGEKFPVVKPKLLLSLCLVLDPRLNLKAFAKAHGAAYGTVRNWRGEPLVLEKQSQLVNEFADRYLAEFIRVCSADKPKPPPLRALRRSGTVNIGRGKWEEMFWGEIDHYRSGRLLLALVEKMDKMGFDEGAPWPARLSVKHFFFRLGQVSFDNDPELAEKFIRDDADFRKRWWHLGVDRVVRFIEDGEPGQVSTETILKVLEEIKGYISRVTDERADWIIKYHIKRERRSRKGANRKASTK